MKDLKVVRVSMSAEAFARLSEKRREEGFPGIASYLLHLAGELDDDSEASDIVKQCFSKALKRAPGKRRFALKDLFVEEVWKEFSPEARKKAGRLFFAEVNRGVDGIVAVRESETNAQRYVRVPD